MAKLSVDQALLKAKSHAKKGEIGEAQKLYQAVLQAFPKNKRAQQGLTTLNKPKQPATAQGPPQDTINQLINLYNQGQLGAVVEQAQALTQQYPEAFIIWNILGAANKGLGRVQAASEAFKKVTELNPNYADGFSNLGVTLQEQGKLEEAIEACNKALSLKPDYAEAYYNMGNALKEQGKLEEAIDAYKKALAIKPEYAEAYNNMGNALNDQGKLEKAIEAYNKTLAIKPDYAEAYYNMGNALKEQGKLEKAIEAFDKALVIKPDYAEAHLGLNNAQKRLVPAWHLEMMNDSCRNKAYSDAIKLAVSKGDFVIEIGTGSGLLAMMAAASGSKQIITCESSKTISEVAKKIISENNYDDVIKVINKKSTELIVGEDLPRKADVIISEVLSAEFVGEGVQTTVLDANKRLLRKNGKMLPESGDIRIALIGEDAEINANVTVGKVCGFDLSKFNSIMGNKFFPKFKNKPRLLSETEIAFKINLYGSEQIIKKQEVLNLTVQESGTCFGVVQWLGIQIFKDIEYENKPGEIISHWPTPIYMFESPKEVIAGDVIKIRASLLKDSVWFQYID
ncbi:tetratricopeptide repeat protein [Rhodobacteraceae bacterium IMCC15231]|nr:tetratricopeptide repeat protein [Rhodobacteraceae bacterium IMCC15231]